MPNHSKRLLIISLLFAPDARVGAKRFTFLSEIFEKTFDCLHILTINDRQIPNKDKTLSGGGKIHRVKMYPPFPSKKTNNFFYRAFYSLWRDYFCLLDPYSGWILPAFIKALKIVRNNNIEKVIITGPPFSPMMIGILLSLFSKAKIHLDYRDPWSNNRSGKQNLLKAKANRFAEKIAVRYASGFIFCSQIMKNDFIGRFSENSSKQYTVITNGFFPNDLLKPITLNTSGSSMLYAGNFYGERQLSIIARPLANLAKAGTITKDSFQFHIFGALNEKDRNTIQELALEDVIIEHPKVTYENILQYMKGACFLFLPSASNVEYAIPFKLFDYFSVKKPIFAVAPNNSAVADIMKEVDCGIITEINNETSIQNGLLQLLSGKPSFTFTNSERYTWDKIASRYTKFINFT